MPVEVDELQPAVDAGEKVFTGGAIGTRSCYGDYFGRLPLFINSGL
jgi:hypothetical protein